MNKILAIFCGFAADAALNGCAWLSETQQGLQKEFNYWIGEMSIEEPQQPRIQEIVDKHQQRVNRAEELDLLCNKAWVPVYIKGQEGVDGKNAITLPPEVQAYIEFSRDGKISGFAGVNVFNGSFAVTAPNLLRFGALVTTLQAGPHLDYEMLMMAQLNDVDHFEMLKDGQIEFKKRDMLMMRCKPVASKDVKRKAQPKALTPVPPEPKTNIAVKGNTSKPASRSNPALPTVEKTPVNKAKK